MEGTPSLTHGQRLLRVYLDATNRLACGCSFCGCGVSLALVPVPTGGAVGVWLLV